MRCLICGENVDVVTNDDGSIDTSNAWKCEACHSFYHFDKRNKIIDGKLCGLGCVIKYDYINRGLAPVPTKENKR